MTREFKIALVCSIDTSNLYAQVLAHPKAEGSVNESSTPLGF